MKCDSQKKWFTGVEVTITNEVWFSGKVIHVALTLTNEVGLSGKVIHRCMYRSLILKYLALYYI